MRSVRVVPTARTTRHASRRLGSARHGSFAGVVACTTTTCNSTPRAPRRGGNPPILTPTRTRPRRGRRWDWDGRGHGRAPAGGGRGPPPIGHPPFLTPPTATPNRTNATPPPPPPERDTSSSPHALARVRGGNASGLVLGVLSSSSHHARIGGAANGLAGCCTGRNYSRGPRGGRCRYTVAGDRSITRCPGRCAHDSDSATPPRGIGCHCPAAPNATLRITPTTRTPPHPIRGYKPPRITHASTTRRGSHGSTPHGKLP